MFEQERVCSYFILFYLSTYRHKVEKIVQLGCNATSAHVICIFLSFPVFFSSSFLLFLRLLMWLADNMTLKLLSEWDETLYALLLKSFVIEAVPYLWYSCSVAPSVRHQ